MEHAYAKFPRPFSQRQPDVKKSEERSRDWASGNRASNGYAISLLVNRFIILEVCWSQYKIQEVTIWAGFSVVRSARPGSLSSFLSATCTAPSIGTLVNSDSTSKDTMISSSWRLSSHDYRLTAYAGYEVSWADHHEVLLQKTNHTQTVLIQDTTFLRGVSALWILDKP